MSFDATLTTLLPNGMASGTTADGAPILVWGGLPDEVVHLHSIKRHKRQRIGDIETVLSAHPDRVAPMEAHYISCSPWQIVSSHGETNLKLAILRDLFRTYDIVLPDFTLASATASTGYRNKIEYSFTTTADGNLSLAFFERMGRRRLAIPHCQLANPTINAAAAAVLQWATANAIPERSLKSLIIRANTQGEMLVGLFLRDRLPLSLPRLLPTIVGATLIYSDPRSPFARVTEILTHDGADTIEEEVGGTRFAVALSSFFQVNLPAFQSALATIRPYLLPDLPLIDLYSGVGTIGLALRHTPTTLIESDPFCVAMAAKNITTNQRQATLIAAPAERALQHLERSATLIVDPPRVGLHHAVASAIASVQPRRVIYLSCNPESQARDAKLLLTSGYTITAFHPFNFFPRTPHIESLLVLDAQPS